PNMVGTEKVHGAPLGKDEIAVTRAALGWSAEPFEMPADVQAAWDARARGAVQQAQWQQGFVAYAARYPAEAAEFLRRMRGDLPVDFADRFQALLAETVSKGETVASRKASQLAITQLVQILPEMLGGSADLTGSNYTDWKGAPAVRAAADGS